MIKYLMLLLIFIVTFTNYEHILGLVFFLDDFIFQKTFYARYILRGAPCDKECLRILAELTKHFSQEGLTEDGLHHRIKKALKTARLKT